MSSDDALDGLSPQWVGAEDLEWLPHEILPNLFMGGTGDLDVVTVPKDNPDLIANHGFDAVVTLYARAQPVGWGVVEHRFGFPDSMLAPKDKGRIIQAARWTHERWSSGDRVLVRCQAGLNRSGLVLALALMIEGYTAQDAIELLRQQRSEFVLCNRQFERWVQTDAHADLFGQDADGE
ncbi:unannotated protein [freshwater metagenome]|uniref:Unannotated protein n=1 Tax=freshwater metagenome TaxID=449393 RepID=A0A6J7DSV2_9ZZZZ|nr:hypothetical protein [Actinomycetota bacterium]